MPPVFQLLICQFDIRSMQTHLDLLEWGKILSKLLLCLRSSLLHKVIYTCALCVRWQYSLGISGNCSPSNRSSFVRRDPCKLVEGASWSESPSFLLSLALPGLSPCAQQTALIFGVYSHTQHKRTRRSVDRKRWPYLQSTVHREPPLFRGLSPS